MIDIKELRVGSYVQQGSAYYKLDENALIDILDHYKVFKEILYQPIPLTETWLLRLGLKKQGDSDFYYKAQFGISFNADYFSYKSCVFSTNNLNYIHQLQNLVWDIAGEKINPDYFNICLYNQGQEVNVKTI